MDGERMHAALELGDKGFVDHAVALEAALPAERFRVKPDKDRRLRAQCPACEWPNCEAPATHRAPKGRLREREYWRFCLEHVREYNHAYNFFAGMTTEDIARYQKEAVIGHRPTWKMGMNGGRPSSRSRSSRLHPEFTGADDPL